MKKLIKVIFLFNFVFSTILYSQNRNKIYIIDIMAETPMDISCKDFNKYFQDMLTEINLKKNCKKKILLLFSVLKPIELRMDIDTRYKGNFLYKGKVYNFCGGNKSININDKFYTLTPELYSFLEQLLKKYEKKPLYESAQWLPSS